VSYDAELANRVREQLAVEPGVSEQTMFGGLAFLLDGNLILAVSRQGGLLVRIRPENQAQVLARSHTEEAVMAGRPRTGWARVLPDGLKTTRQLQAWVRRGVEATLAVPPKRRRRR
jgi:hypothetical protein